MQNVHICRKKHRPPPNSDPLKAHNPEYEGKTPRELQDEMRKLKSELIARGFNCEVKLTYLQNIKI